MFRKRKTYVGAVLVVALAISLGVSDVGAACVAEEKRQKQERLDLSSISRRPARRRSGKRIAYAAKGLWMRFGKGIPSILWG